MKITAQKCEYLENPAVIGTRKPRFSWILEAEESGVFQRAYRIEAAESEENLNNGELVWDSGIVETAESANIEYAGQALESKKTYFWRVSLKLNAGRELKSGVASFGMGLLLESDWRSAFIGQKPEEMTVSEKAGEKAGAAAPFLRKTFTINKKVKTAKAFATAYGVYELHLNGKKAGDAELEPGWTDYEKSLQYQCYDVTSVIKEGENAAGAILADGWFAGNIAIAGRKQYGGYPLGLRLHLALEYEDGTSDIVVTDTSWKTSSGPILFADNQTGEYYDATRELAGWDKPGYDDSGWKDAVEAWKFNGNRLKANIGPLVKKVFTRNVESVSVDKDGNIIVDMGQNMVGGIKIRVKAEKGQEIRFRYGEMLKDDGTIYTENLRSALQTDYYKAGGNPEGEIFEPAFTFHGFRYVEIKGLSYKPEKDDIIGNVIYSACPQSGKIETSNAMVNRLFQNQLWGQRGNFVSVPTDCPQRDERMGWTGDAQIFCGTACFNMDCAGFYEKYVEDCLEAQKPNGSVTDVAPCVKMPGGKDLVGNGNAAWGDVIFVIPWNEYRMYGNKRLLEKAYDGMVRYLDYLEGTTVDLIRPDAGYGDWLSVDDDTPCSVMSTAYFAYDADIVSKAAAALGRKEESERYAAFRDEIKKAFNREFVAEDGIIKGDTQCGYVLALKMNLLPENLTETAVNNLIRTIERKNWHLSTGFVGVSYLLPMLSEHGHSDVAYRLLLNDTYPSWGYSIKNGATTIWERWNSYTKENGFGDVGMNSFNHYSLGSVGEWMYRYMAGINPLEPGFRRIQIKPYISDKLSFVNAEYDSLSGGISSCWRIADGTVFVDIGIPANTTAEISLPSAGVKQTAGKAASLGVRDGRSVFEAGSGRYSFSYKL